MISDYPTREEWDAAVSAGFRSNGCSHSPDHLVLSGIALANLDPLTYPPGICDLHDYRYWWGGNELDRAHADCELYCGVIALIEDFASEHTYSGMAPVWREQALIYFTAVRSYGRGAWGRSESDGP